MIFAKSRAKSGFLDEFTELHTGNIRPFVTQGCECQEDFRKRLQIMAMIDCDLGPLDTRPLVVVNSSEAEKRGVRN